ncbi:hypothetical protein EJB05_51914, partial [Eragrostis curvula]
MDPAGEIQKVASMRRGGSGSMWRRGDDVFSRSSRDEDDEEALRWAALERLPTHDRVRRAIVPLGLGDEAAAKGVVDVDVLSLGPPERRALLERLVRVADEDNERFLLKLKERVDRVGIDMPTIEVRFKNLDAEAEVRVGSSGLPTVLNSIVNTLEEAANALHILPSTKQTMPVLHDVSGIIKPRRMTLLLGPPGSGKTTLLLALAGRLDKDLKVKGKVTYNGHEMSEFVPERTAAYISQHDLHIGEMTVRETLAFSARCQGVGDRFDMLTELSRREKAANIKPDADIDAFMKARQEANVVTDYILKILGLDICADTMVGDEMLRGISGGQRKRVTTVSLRTVDYETSEFRRNKALIKELSQAAPGSNDLHFPSKYSQSSFTQLMACLWKQNLSYWRNPPYNTVRFFFTTIIALLLGTIFWDLGGKVKTSQDLFNAMGSMYSAVLFIGIMNCTSVQPVVAVERTVFYRERAAGMYSAFPYAMGQVVIELPYALVQAILYGVIVYSMIGFEWTAAKFFWYLFFGYFTLLYFTFYGMMAVGLTPNYHIAAIVSSAFYAIWNLFSGFIIPRPVVGEEDKDCDFFALEENSCAAVTPETEALTLGASVLHMETDAAPRTRGGSCSPRHGEEMKAEEEEENGAADQRQLGAEERRRLLERLVKVPREDNGEFLARIKQRMDRMDLCIGCKESAEVETPTIEVRFENLSINAEAYVGKRGIPTVANFFMNKLEEALNFLHVIPTKKVKVSILHEISGIIKPSRLTLLLGPPGSGRTSLLLALAGQLDSALKMSGIITFNGRMIDEFIPQRCAAYVSQEDMHLAEMTVRETLSFSARCQGTGARQGLLSELVTREKLANIKPDPDIDLFMKARINAMHWKSSKYCYASSQKGHADIVTDYILKNLELEMCSDILVGDPVMRGISGGQKKRVTTVMTVFLRTELHHDNIEDGIIYIGIMYGGLNTSIFNGYQELVWTVSRLPVFYKQRNIHLYPAWAYVLPMLLLKIPVSLTESIIWTAMTYYMVGFDPSIVRMLKQILLFTLVSQMAYGKFRLLAALGRDMVTTYTITAFADSMLLAFGGFFISRTPIKRQIILSEDTVRERRSSIIKECTEASDSDNSSRSQRKPENRRSTAAKKIQARSLKKPDGMVLPFMPLTMVFKDIKYSIDMPKEMKAKGATEDRLTILNGLTGALQPGVLTALMGVSGAVCESLMYSAYLRLPPEVNYATKKVRKEMVTQE